MYKVFYKDRTVFFIENDQNKIKQDNSITHSFKNKKQLKKTLSLFLDNPELKSLIITHKEVEFAFKEFAKLYKLIEAAGGLVKNNNNNILVIFRHGKWDLPKGKLEKNEHSETSAKREVEEECGIGSLEILNLLEISYHTYKLNGEDILKRTYWYEMFHSGNQEPKPQIEEDITEAKWIKSNEIHAILSNTFPSIVEVFNKAGIVTNK